MRSPVGSTVLLLKRDVRISYGGAKLTDKHLASKIHCVDDGIIGWRGKAASAANQQHRQSAQSIKIPLNRGTSVDRRWHLLG